MNVLPRIRVLLLLVTYVSGLLAASFHLASEEHTSCSGGGHGAVSVRGGSSGSHRPHPSEDHECVSEPDDSDGDDDAVLADADATCDVTEPVVLAHGESPSAWAVHPRLIDESPPHPGWSDRAEPPRAPPVV